METRAISTNYQFQLLSLEELIPYYFPKRLETLSTQPTFNITLAYNKFRQFASEWNYYDLVCPYLYLGRIPDAGLPDRTRLIISLVTYGELAEIKFDFRKLEENGIRHLYVHMEDYTASVSLTSVINAIKTIRAYIQSNNNDDQEKYVYVHCKAGRARSAMTVIAYQAYEIILKDLKRGKQITDGSLKQALQEATESIQKNRIQVDVNINKMEMAMEILKGLLAEEIKPDITEHDHVYDYLASLEFKNILCQLPSFKNLCIYLASLDSTRMRGKRLQEFLGQILFASNEADVDSWYGNMIQGNSILDEFINSSPTIYTNDYDNRKTLADDFKNELSTHIKLRFLHQPEIKTNLPGLK